ncbi:ATP-dependent exoDNAse (exonuclease V) beta subunit [Desulfobaculum xiamenense]|uniref:DNA 3'-5' helicase n=1 Tax=Desulfobaculum xiamenense TaxID=995050 RepID=A0A846QR00_9BACT|nr:UvrD-helicase domain-containing protein [Desulfobaculum xiamenense]NJB69410.1 ATP-dependent exoDNAse (exonuclease V) beta subunit [Desulfobaculum xiamenense]
MLEQVKASAGSGKTFELTTRFLRLLRGATDGLPAACGAVPGGGYGWSEIMAVTFTNKAAAEMKERVVSSLKARALGSTGGPAGEWDRAEAALWLSRILRHYQQLNIRTIDSLLNTFMRIFALEIGVAPDFDVVFDVGELYDELFDQLTASAEQGGEDEQRMLTRALDAMLLMEHKPGFNLCAAFRERLLAVLRFRLEHDDDFETDPARLHEAVTDLCDAFRNAARDMRDIIAAGGIDAASNFMKFLDKCVDHDGFGKVPESAYMGKTSLCDCVKKSGLAAVTDEAENAFDTLVRAWLAYSTGRPILQRARDLAAFIPLADTLIAGMHRIERDKGVLLHGRSPSLALGLLDHGTGVPDAYCRMGTRLMHMLIDEFQDTGRDQWQALHPLASECIAKGGGVFFVGDVKQAIYGWRGGDARLFDEVPEDPELSAMTDTLRNTLPCNWRSREEIIAFNNAVFERLATPTTATAVASAMLGDAPSYEVESFGNALVDAFDGAAQDIPPHRQGSGGYVHLQLVRGELKEDLYDNVRERLRVLFTEDILRRRPCGDAAVLVRSNAEAAEVSRWLIDWGIPVITENSLSLAEHPLIRQLAALMTFLDYPFDDLALWEFVSGEEIFLRHTDLSRDAMVDWLVGCDRGPLFPRLREAFPEAWERHISPFQQQAGLMSPYDMVREVCRHYRVIERNPQDELFVRRFMEVVHAAEESGRQSLSAFLEYWRESGGEEKVPLPESIDAVRVMTIHQSKGLEFPVCIIPFHHWASDPSRDLAVLEQGAVRLLVPMCKELGGQYWQRCAELMQEQLNLLYVAWTRPVAELHCLITSTKHYDRYPFVRGLDTLLHTEDWKPGEDGLPHREFGTRPAVPDAVELPAHAAELPAPDEAPAMATVAEPSVDADADEAALPMGWLPRLKIHRHFSKDLTREDMLAGRVWDERARGTLMHTTLDRLRLTGDTQADLRRAAAGAVAAHADILPVGDEVRAAIADEATDILAWAMSVPGFATWKATGSPECPILDAEGNEHRPDLLVSGPDGTLVVEYKTGAQKPEHIEQVRRYLRLVAAMDGLPAPHRGIILYLDRRTTLPVAPTHHGDAL